MVQLGSSVLNPSQSAAFSLEFYLRRNTSNVAVSRQCYWLKMDFFFFCSMYSLMGMFF